jgi:hypothetical protein
VSELLPLATWVPILDGDPLAAAMYLDHYSSERSRSRRVARGTLLTLGPGQKLLLATPCRRATFAWRVFIDDTGETGVNCAWFRNEGAGIASDLIRAADRIADQRWRGERHYTYVDPEKVKGNPPGNCFLHAGWRYVLDENGEPKTTGRGLLILERLAQPKRVLAA